MKIFIGMKKMFFITVLTIISNCLFAQSKTITFNNEQDTIYNVVDVLPSFTGGDEGWKKYMKKNLKYPKKAWWEELETDVTLEFVVRKDGSITDINHLTVFGWGFEEEATRFLKNCEKWKPAMKNGKPVNYHGKLTIPFRLK